MRYLMLPTSKAFQVLWGWIYTRQWDQCFSWLHAAIHSQQRLYRSKVDCRFCAFHKICVVETQDKNSKILRKNLLTVPDHKPTDQVHGYNSCIFDVFKRSLDALISLVSITSLFPTAIQMVPTGFFGCTPPDQQYRIWPHLHRSSYDSTNPEPFLRLPAGLPPHVAAGFRLYIQPLLFAFIAVRNIASLKILGATCDTRYSVCR